MPRITADVIAPPRPCTNRAPMRLARLHPPPQTPPEPRAEEHPPALRRAAQQGREREDRQPGEEHAPAPDQVADAPGEQEDAAEGDQVGVDDPGEVRLGEAEVVLHRWQGDVHDRLVEDDHQHPDAEDNERDPAVAVGTGGGLHGHGGTVADRLVSDNLLRTDYGRGSRRRTGCAHATGSARRSPTSFVSARRKALRSPAGSAPRTSSRIAAPIAPAPRRFVAAAL